MDSRPLQKVQTTVNPFVHYLAFAQDNPVAISVLLFLLLVVSLQLNRLRLTLSFIWFLSSFMYSSAKPYLYPGVSMNVTL